MGTRRWLRLLLLPALETARAIHGRHLMRRFRRPPDAVRPAPHALPGELVVSLTSYPARFPTLDLTLRSLLAQNVMPDRLILWIAHGDMDLLPERVLALQDEGLSIRPCDDIRSYKKLIPALQAFPGAYIVTADDDVHYASDWLATLVEGVTAGEQVVVARRTHRLKRRQGGRIAPYAGWQWDVRDAAAQRPSTDLVPTGAGGILYPPGAFGPAVLDRALFTRLCPDGDDIWFYWLARLNGTRHRQAGGRFWRINWPSSQRSSLWSGNEGGGNDRMIAAMEAEFGPLP